MGLIIARHQPAFEAMPWRAVAERAVNDQHFRLKTPIHTFEIVEKRSIQNRRTMREKPFSGGRLFKFGFLEMSRQITWRAGTYRPAN